MKRNSRKIIRIIYLGFSARACARDDDDGDDEIIIIINYRMCHFQLRFHFRPLSFSLYAALLTSILSWELTVLNRISHATYTAAVRHKLP